MDRPMLIAALVPLVPAQARGDVLRVIDEYVVSATGVSAAMAEPTPVALILSCPVCGKRHIDKGEFATKPHHTHACQTCGMVWRPALINTVGVEFLPGFKDAP